MATGDSIVESMAQRGGCMSGKEAGERNAILLMGRLLLAACFLPTAIGRMANISGFAVSLSLKGLPYADALAAIVVLAETFGPLALIFGLAPRTSACALFLATVITTGTMHRFWDFVGAARLAEQAIFVANLGVLAGLLFYLASGPGAWSGQAWWRAAGEKPKPSAKKKQSRPRSPRPRPAPARPNPADEEWADAA
jgi:putative oxidoreductase